MSEKKNDLPWEEVNPDYVPAIRGNNASPSEQPSLAPDEHRAAAREIVGRNPLMAIPFAVATPLYQAKKLITRAEDETPASMEQLKAGFKGIGEGIIRAGKMPWEELNANITSDLKERAGSILDAAKGVVKRLMPWEETNPDSSKSKKPLSNIVKEPAIPPDGQHTSLYPTEKTMAKAVMFSKDELLRHMLEERTPKNISNLDAEISRVKDKKAKQILMNYRESLRE